MKSFDPDVIERQHLSMELVRMIRMLGEFKGKELEGEPRQSGAECDTVSH